MMNEVEVLCAAVATSVPDILQQAVLKFGKHINR